MKNAPARVDVVRAPLPVVEDEHALIECQDAFLQVGARLLMQGSLLFREF